MEKKVKTNDLVCRTKTCSHYDILYRIQDDGSEYRCLGECGNILRKEANDYIAPPKEESLDERIIRLATDTVIQILTDLELIPEPENET